jgi:hypothetical protein
MTTQERVSAHVARLRERITPVYDPEWNKRLPNGKFNPVGPKVIRQPEPFATREEGLALFAELDAVKIAEETRYRDRSTGASVFNGLWDRGFRPVERKQGAVTKLFVQDSNGVSVQVPKALAPYVRLLERIA